MKYSYIFIAALTSTSVTVSADDSATFNGSVEAGYTHNSRLSVAELDDVSSQGASGVMLKANLNGKLKVSEKAKITANYSYASQDYQDFEQYDLAIHQASIDASYALSYLDIGLRHDTAIANLDSERFLLFNQSSLYAAKMLSSTTYLRANGKYKTKRFSSFKQRDAQSVGVGLDLFYFFPNASTIATAGVSAEDEKAVEEQYGFESLGINTKLSHSLMFLGTQSKVSLAWRYQKREYQELQTDYQITEPQVPSSIARDDFQNIYQLQWQVDLLPNVAVKTALEYGDYNSTLQEQTYSQTLTTLSLQASF